MWWVSLAFADTPIATGDVVVDRPTLTSIGVRWEFAGDDDGDAVVTLRYRETGGTWKDALRPHRVRPENVVGRNVDPEYAGSVFGLRPSTAYDLELTASDADGAFSRQVIPAPEKCSDFRTWGICGPLDDCLDCESQALSLAPVTSTTPRATADSRVTHSPSPDVWSFPERAMCCTVC